MANEHNPYALRGRIVTMDAQNPDDQDSVINDGIIYIKDGHIVAVVDRNDPSAQVTPGFEDIHPVDTRGTIFPGLVELHNHLSYNILPLWQVPDLPKYTNNGQWRNSPAKTQFISGPMRLLNDAGGYLGAIVRYVEAKCLVAGVTTSQGLTLIDASSIPKKYRGIVRNTEEPDDDNLPSADHRIADIDDKSGPIKAEDFLQRLQHLKGSFLLHLSEGIDDKARSHFQALECADHVRWAITDALIGIHSAGLFPEDFPIFKQFNGSMVWSPLSNLMLYGDTAHIQAAKDLKVLIALGSDWSPSGSKNLLAELKIARLYSKKMGNIFSDVELVRMVTSNPARMLKWNNFLGSIEQNKIADLLVISGKTGSPYAKLLTASEMEVRLVIIGGIPRYGTTSLMQQLGQDGEKWTIAGDGQSRGWILNLTGAPDADVSRLTLKEAHDVLEAALTAMPDVPIAPPPPIGAAFGEDAPAKQYKLVLDNDGMEAKESRILAPLTTGEVIAEIWAATVDLHAVVKSMHLDNLTVAEDPQLYVDALKKQPRIPPIIRDGLPGLYGAH